MFFGARVIWIEIEITLYKSSWGVEYLNCVNAILAYL